MEWLGGRLRLSRHTDIQEDTMIGIVTGVVVKSGTSQYGGWCLVAEAEVTTKSGKTFTPKTMCSGDTVPSEGAAVIAQGFVTAKSSERGGKHYADASLNACRFTILSGGGEEKAAKAQETFEEDIPF